jgi:hypothetical protein
MILAVYSEVVNMQNDYLSFLNYRAAQRRLAAKFARPRRLMLHTLAFIVVMTVIWAYGIAWELWYFQQNFQLPVLVGVVWSVLLLLHALIHYRHSAAMSENRELAVEAEMRPFTQDNRDQLDNDSLFTLHRKFEADLEAQGRWSVTLLAFAVVNFISWGVSAFNIGSSWPFQMTLPLAIMTLGGVNLFLNWQHRRQTDRGGWFVRLPLLHLIAYGAGVIALGIAGMYRMINYWDVDTVIKGWGIVLLLHILLNVIVWPLMQRFLPENLLSTIPTKRKPPARLVLSDDGEVLDIEDEDANSFSGAASQNAIQ